MRISSDVTAYILGGGSKVRRFWHCYSISDVRRDRAVQAHEDGTWKRLGKRKGGAIWWKIMDLACYSGVAVPGVAELGVTIVRELYPSFAR